MAQTTLKARFDGQQIVLEDSYRIPDNANLLVTILEPDLEHQLWATAAQHSLTRAYGDDEPEYSLEKVIEHNQNYARR
jgi:hypothetical protein